MSTPNDSASEQVYGVCLKLYKDTIPSITIYRATYIYKKEAQSEAIEMDSHSYFFQVTDSICSEIEQYSKQESIEGKVLSWVIETSAPACLSQKIENMFREKGVFAKWSASLNAYGIIDELNLRESSTLADCAIVDMAEHLLYFSCDAISFIAEYDDEPGMLIIDAYVINFRNKKLWHILKVARGKYSNEKRQNLKTTALANIGQYHKNCQIYLISRKGVVENCAKYAPELIGNIVKAMSDV